MKKNWISTLSFAAIVKNERPRIQAFVEQLQHPVFSQVVIVDTGSTDGTWEWLKENAKFAELFQIPWRDHFSEAREFSFSKTNGDLILWLDADDRIAKDAYRVLEKIRKTPKERLAGGYESNYHHFDIVSGKVERTITRLQLVNRSNAPKWRYRIFEQLELKTGSRIEKFDLDVFHQVDPKLAKAKKERNSKLLKRSLKEEGRHYNNVYFLAEQHAVEEKLEEAQKLWLESLEMRKLPYPLFRVLQISYALKDEAALITALKWHRMESSAEVFNQAENLSLFGYGYELAQDFKTAERLYKEALKSKKNCPVIRPLESSYWSKVFPSIRLAEISLRLGKLKQARTYTRGTLNLTQEALLREKENPSVKPAKKKVRKTRKRV